MPAVTTPDLAADDLAIVRDVARIVRRRDPILSMLLDALASNAGAVITREELIVQLRPASARAIDCAAVRAREALHYTPATVRRVWGVGLVLCAGALV